jgi:two-component system, LytTR family, sensor kinase
MRTAAPRTRVSIVGEAGAPSETLPPAGEPRRSLPIEIRASAPGKARLHRGLEILLIWSIVGLFIAAQRYLRGPSLQPRLALPWGESLAASLVTAYLWALLTPAVMRLARTLRPRAATAVWTIPALLSAGGAAALLHLTATNVFWHAVGPPEGSGDFSAMFLATLAFGGAARLATFFGIVGVTWGLDDYRTYREKELQASELERELVQTQLEALKLRLHPPFLFNTLSTILPLIRTEPRAAARTVVQLGDILRLALHNDATGLVPLKTELEYIRLYLQIEQTRLQDRLDVHFAISPEVLDAAVPNLILLPLAESAIANGVSVRPGRASIEIRAWPEEGALRLEVHESAADSAEGPAAVAIDDSFVRKTKMRLELLYPERHRVSISDRLEKGHDVSLRLPLEPAARVPAAAGAA